MMGRCAQMGFVAVAAVLSTACGGLHEAKEAYADLLVVRRAVQPRVGSSAVEARIANGTTLTVTIVNSPMRLLPSEQKQAKARELARVAYDAYADRARLGGVQIVFLARGGSQFFTISTSEAHPFAPSALSDDPSAPAPTT